MCFVMFEIPKKVVKCTDIWTLCEQEDKNRNKAN